MPLVRSAALNLNGISIAYVMGLVNGIFACLVAFGVSLNDQEIASVSALINAALILAVHFGHRVGEASASGVATAQSRIGMGVEHRHDDPPQT